MNKVDKDSLYYVFLEILRLHYYRTHVLLEEVGVYPGQPPMLFILNEKDGQSQKELADKLQIKSSTITVMLKRMENSGLVTRRKDELDQRITRVYITKKGKEICNEAIGVMNRVEEEMFRNITIEERIILRRLFMQIRENLNNALDMK
ncbi:MarR family winged helix-turn-helix transcriptional regulator [Anaerosalibacter massiliensis]|uniref:MarR family transcriptional regulator n=1 Tax=Anaerosalibacter massiliensis TaxID=1347392 RepID=A0A9X2MJS4_9FIRM|nr:MarR family transcriptional regulator [Anaerosalibacter massiliensis]MCR2045024.1 MarR family transcriptional regulator [Anaerosalibacter massiliensis]